MTNNLLTDGTIRLRALEPTDLDKLYKWENDTSLWEIGNTISPYSKAQLWEYLQNYDGDIYKSHQLRLMIELEATKESVGTIDLYEFDPFNNRTSIGILIDKEYQKMGFGTRAIALATKYTYSYLGLKQVNAIIPLKNTASISLFQKSGFQESGRLRDWLKIGQSYYDVIIMQLVFN